MQLQLSALLCLVFLLVYSFEDTFFSQIWSIFCLKSYPLHATIIHLPTFSPPVPLHPKPISNVNALLSIFNFKTM